MVKIVLFGAHGWIGSQWKAHMDAMHKETCSVIIPPMRADDVAAVKRFLEDEKPDRVVCFIGRTHGEGIPTIDYLELPGKLQLNVRDNLFAPLALALLCKEMGIHLTYLGTGCIFSQDNPEDSRPYTEADAPDFFGSSYSIVKGFTDRLMHLSLLQDTVLNVRIRMPIVSEHHPRNFITKITHYEKVCSVPNSMTVLDSLWPYLTDMILTGRTGTINLTNPGCISHNEILELYKQYVDPTFTWQNFSIEEQHKILLSKRSNNVLDTSLLQAWYPDVPSIQDAVTECLKRYQKA